MKIYPAIDLINGNCVRLYKGDYSQKKEYSNDPIALGKKFAAEGAKYIHIIDLDGAKNPTNNQHKLISKIISETGLKAQVGGGIRTLTQATDLFLAGVDRIIFGSLAITQPQLVKEIASKFGSDNIIIGIDCFANNGIHSTVAVSGWQEQSEQTVTSVITDFLKYGICNFLCTDINRDGTLTEPNFELMSELIKTHQDANFIVSGGVATLEHIKKARLINADSIVIGKALYENRFTLSEALQC